MKKNRNKLTGVVLATAMGLGCAGYPVYAQEETEVNVSNTVEDGTGQEQTDIVEEPDKETDDTTDVKEPTEDTETVVEEETNTATDEEPAVQTLNEADTNAENNAGSFNVTGGVSGSNWTYDSDANTLTFNNSGTYTVTGDGTQTSEKIIVSDNFNGTITIKNINISADIAFEVKNTAKLTLMLEGDNTLASTDSSGLKFEDAVTGHLTINSNVNGSLTASGVWSSAGIGGGATRNSGNNITINGGNITATSYYGAGIGGGWRGNSDNITINGGNITAISSGGAGIGAGSAGTGKNVVITGGSVKASSISTTPTDGKGNNVYLVKVDNMPGFSKITVDGKTYTKEGNHPDNDDIFYLYLTGQDHQMTSNGKSASIKWDNSNSRYVTQDIDFFGINLKVSSTDVTSNWFYDLIDNKFNLLSGDNYTITGYGTEVNSRIIVADNFNGTVTLENINIKGTDEIISLGENTHLTLKFNGENYLATTTGGKATISTTFESSSLTFDSDTNGILNVSSSSSGVAIGSMTNTYNITFNGGTVNAKGSSYQESDIGVALYGNGDAKNIVVNGGSINCLTSALGNSYSGNKFYIIECQITINGGTVTAPYIGGSTADSWGAPATSVIVNGGSVKGNIQTYETLSNSNNQGVYLVKLKNQSGIDKVTIDDAMPYERSGDHPDGDGDFYLYLTGENHTITVGDKTYKVYWDKNTNTLKFENIIPTISIDKKTSTGITIQPLENQDIYGTAEYKINEGQWQESNEFTGLEVDTEYTVYARYKGNDRYTQSETGRIIVKTLKDGNALVEDSKPTNLSGVYGQKLSEIKLPDDWTWVDKDTALSVGTQSYIARFDTTGYEKEYDFTGIEEYNAEQHYVKMNLTIDVLKADSSITITTSSLDKAYDGNAVEIPEYTKSGSKGQVTIKWQKNTGTDSSPVWEDLTDAPSTAGSYQVVVELAGDDNYESASVTKKFAISKSENKWVKELSIDNWTYGDEAKNPIATSKYGEVVFTYSNSKDGTYTDTVPTNAGTYYVKATVAGNENYSCLEEIMSFEISKAVPEYSVPTDLTIEQGNPLSAVKLPKGFTWKDSTQTTDTLGTKLFKAVFTPEDTANYQTVELDITVEVVPAVSVINKAPKITAEDKTLKVGDTFDAKKDVTATDAEDGDITAQIEVIKNTVDTTQAGTYEVTYKVTDSQGASATKIINVMVNPKMEVVNEAPVINAEDKTLTVGDNFDPMDGVTAIDKEDGNLTDSIQITENTVDTSKAGKYTVVYEVTDSHGTRVVRTIYVTVQQKTTDTDKEDSNKNSTKDTAQTSTQTNVMAWSVLGIASLGALLAVLFKRKHQ